MTFWLRCIRLTLPLVVGATLVGCGPDETGTSRKSDGPGSRVFTDEYCAQQAPILRRRYPNVYYTEQEAYDGCRQAGAVADDLYGDDGDIDRRP